MLSPDCLRTWMPRRSGLVGLVCVVCCTLFSHDRWLNAQVATPTSSAQVSSIRLDDVTDRSGIEFRHFSGGTGKHYIVETVTSGVATLDYDGDGWIDIYLLSGCELSNDTSGTLSVQPQAQAGPARYTSRLYRNIRGMRFEDVSVSARAAEPGFALGVVAGDYDNDGDTDIFLSNYGPSVCLINNGDGTFMRRELESDSGNRRVGAGLSLLDIDQDGVLDLYLARYIKFSFERGVSRTIFGVPAAPGPKDYEPETHTLWRGDGQGGFLDISAQAGIGTTAGPGMGTVAADFDGDGDTDVFVCNDSAANFFWLHQGAHQFEETAMLAGVAYDVTGAQQASMGVDVADYNGDGLLDMAKTSFMDEVPTLYKNSGQGYFDDLAASAGLGSAARNVTWGIAFSDFDNDTWPDLYIASGHLIPGSAKINDTERFAAPNLVFRNLQGRKFANVSAQSGTAAAARQVSRGIAVDDLDNDGRTDVVVLNLNDRPQIIHNVGDVGNYLDCQLAGTQTNRDAIGSRVIAHVGTRRIVQEVIAGRGYQSHFGQRLHFGVGTAEQIDKLEVHWQGGQMQTLGPLPVNGRWLIQQGNEKAQRLP